MSEEDLHIDDKETMEDLGRKGFRLIQHIDGFRYGEDTVLLSYFTAKLAARKRRQLKAMELGANCGAASILLAARREDITIDCVEIQPRAASILERNIRLNKLEDRLRPVCSDIRDFLSNRNKLQDKGTYDLIFMNPPYQTPQRGPKTQIHRNSQALLEARFEMNGSLEDFLAVTHALLCPQGNLTLVHRAVRLPEVLSLMVKYHLEPSHLQFIHPAPDRPATLFLLYGQKDRKPGGFQVLPPLILYDKDRQISSELQGIYNE